MYPAAQLSWLYAQGHLSKELADHINGVQRREPGDTRHTPEARIVDRPKLAVRLCARLHRAVRNFIQRWHARS